MPVVASEAPEPFHPLRKAFQTLVEEEAAGQLPVVASDLTPANPLNHPDNHFPLLHHNRLWPASDRPVVAAVLLPVAAEALVAALPAVVPRWARARIGLFHPTDLFGEAHEYAEAAGLLLAFLSLVVALAALPAVVV